MLVSDYDYDLPEERIAKFPPEKRGSTRLLVLNRKTGEITDSYYRDLADYLGPGDVLVLNNSRVLPARLIGLKEVTNAKIEVLLQKRKDLTNWSVVCKPCKRLKF